MLSFSRVEKYRRQRVKQPVVDIFVRCGIAFEGFALFCSLAIQGMRFAFDT